MSKEKKRNNNTQRKRIRPEYDEQDRFAAFEPRDTDVKSKRPSRTDQRRFEAFDESSRNKADDYFERNYGSLSVSSSKQRNAKPEKTQRDDDTKPVRSKRNEKNTHSKKLSKKQRKIRIILGYVFVFMMFVLIGGLFSLKIMFKTTSIEIKYNGEIPYSDEEIINTSGLKYNENLFLARRKAAVNKIVEKYPYIEAAQIHIKIPDTQVIELETAIPSFQVEISEGFAVISAKGRILEIVSDVKSNIPILKGLKLNNSVEGKYINYEKETTQKILTDVIDNIHENKVPDIYGIDISNAANIKLNYDNRITILLGVPEDIGYKLRTAMAIIGNELSPAERGDLDVSLANSDRKSSYFTPIYSNTVSIKEDTVSSALPKPDTFGNSPARVKSADEYLKKNSSVVSEKEDYIEDIIEDNNDNNIEQNVYENENFSDEQPNENIISEYGTQYR